jgi:multidrug efflux system membrane fusion protein
MKTVITSIIVILFVLGATFLGIKYLKDNAPEAKTKTRVEKTQIVKVEIVHKENLQFPLTSEGVVETSRDTILSAEVAGRIIEVDTQFETGATFEAGEVIARVDPVNFQAAVAQVKSTLADAELNLVQEEARAEQSERDWAKIGGDKKATDLVLRVPFLKSARAKVVAAQAGLDRALEDLARTEIKAPFDCRVRAVSLNVGATVAPGAQLGTIYDHKNLIIRLPFSLDDFAQIPDKSEIKIFTVIGSKSHEWDAEMMWELGEIDEATLSAYILARVLPKPGASPRFQLPVPGIFLKAKLNGAVLPGVVGVPRSAVSGRNQVFVLNENNTLELRKLTIARSTAMTVYASGGIEGGEKVVLTKLEMPVAGMALTEAPAEEKDERKESKTPN